MRSHIIADQKSSLEEIEEDLPSENEQPNVALEQIGSQNELRNGPEELSEPSQADNDNKEVMSQQESSHFKQDFKDSFEPEQPIASNTLHGESMVSNNFY